nr:hypothetical protein [uncultured Campylobacter sp.]
MRRHRELERMALKFMPKLWDLGAGFKIYPRFLPSCTLRCMLLRAAFSSVGFEILNLAAARICSGV